MEKLSTSQRNEIKKLTNLKLMAKLIEAGFDEEAASKMERSALMNAWADMVASGKDKAPDATVSVTSYDPEVEKQRLAMEMELRLKEIALKEKEIEERKQREAMEIAIREKEIEERRQREREERELKLKELALREREIEERKTAKEKELRLQIERDKENKSVVHRAKLCGDAMKNTIARMPMDAVELGSYFKDVEQLFTNFEVLNELRAQLLRPYLNEKAKGLVTRMDPTKSADYKAVKEMLLREFKLSPAVYLEKFNSESRKNDETYVLYSARLKSLLEYYCESRKIERDCDKLIELFVCDRVKSGLPEGCLKHILAIESNQGDGWLSLHELADAIDLYNSNRWHQGLV